VVHFKLVGVSVVSGFPYKDFTPALTPTGLLEAYKALSTACSRSLVDDPGGKQFGFFE